ncbi:DMT family transporter [Geminicoccaceae bacterium 1502E]|nr:DMT family transporter [Geminicoccaceae bacterium 1502E]
MSPSAAAESANLRAALLILASSTLFGIGDAIVKYLSEDWPVGQIVTLRSAVCLMLLGLVRPKREPLVPRGLLQRTNLVRGGFEIGVTFLFFSGLMFMPLGNAVSIMFLAPILLTALAALLLGEQVGWRRWTAVLVGFAGVLVVVRPGLEGWNAAALLPLGAACFIAGRDIVVRWLPPEVTTRTVVVTTSAGLFLAGAVTLPFAWEPLGWKLVLGCVVCGATVTSAFHLYVQATRVAEVSFLQPFKYVAIPLSFVIGFVVWGDVPSPRALLGVALIAASGLFIFHRGRRLRRSAQAGDGQG